MALLAVLAAGLGLATHAFGDFLLASLGAPRPLATEIQVNTVPWLASLMAVLGFVWAYLVYFQKAISASLLMRRFQPL